MGNIKGMGLNRDDTKLRFSETLLNERRRKFWKSHSMEVFQVNFLIINEGISLSIKFIVICFGRP